MVETSDRRCSTKIEVGFSRAGLRLPEGSIGTEKAGRRGVGKRGSAKSPFVPFFVLRFRPCLSPSGLVIGDGAGAGSGDSR